MANRRTGFMIREDLYKRALEYADDNSMSLAGVYNLAIKQFLENEAMKKMIFQGFNQEDFLKKAAEAYVKAQASNSGSADDFTHFEFGAERKTS